MKTLFSSSAAVSLIREAIVHYHRSPDRSVCASLRLWRRVSPVSSSPGRRRRSVGRWWPLGGRRWARERPTEGSGGRRRDSLPLLRTTPNRETIRAGCTSRRTPIRIWWASEKLKQWRRSWADPGEAHMGGCVPQHLVLLISHDDKKPASYKGKNDRANVVFTFKRYNNKHQSTRDNAKMKNKVPQNRIPGSAPGAKLCR